jgi:D-alanyl-D-alanine carboxypeptidase
MAKKKRNGLRLSLAVLFIAIISAAGLITLRQDGTLAELQRAARLQHLNYSQETETFVKQNDLTEVILEKPGRSDFLDAAVLAGVADAEDLNAYFQIPLLARKDYVQTVDQLLDSGYSPAEINCLYSRLPDDKVNLIADGARQDIYVEMVSLPYFNPDSLPQYIAYAMQHPDFTAQQAVTFVELDLDSVVYENAVVVENPYDIDVLLTKHRRLPDDFVPKGLREVDAAYNPYEELLTDEAAEAFEAMALAAEEEGIYLYIGSAYRSIPEQEAVYYEYVDLLGYEGAELRAAHPTYSEHHTGLAVDIWDMYDAAIAEGMEEWGWVDAHAWEYGFIQRYTPGNEGITEYQAESWHYRYVGKELAAAVRRSGLTLDEYLIRKIRSEAHAA